MDDRIERTSDAAAARSTLGRREMLQRTGFVVGAAALWATPVVQTMGMRSAAAGSPPPADFCVGCKGAAPVELVFEYIPSDFGTPIGDGKGGCDEYALEAASGSPFGDDVVVDIKVVMGQGGTETRYFCGIKYGDRIKVLWTGGSPGTLTPRIEATITATGPTTDAQQVIRIHTSCSSELSIDDVFKSLTLRYGRDAEGHEAGERGSPLFDGQEKACDSL